MSPAEVISSRDASVQLISASQAAHWFDLPRFYAEGRRVLCANGVLALYGYGFPRFHWTKDTSKNAMLYEAQNDVSMILKCHHENYENRNLRPCYHFSFMLVT